MKNLLFKLSVMALGLSAASLFAETPPVGVDRFMSNLEGGSGYFTDHTIWTAYRQNDEWHNITLDTSPWLLPIAATNTVYLKFDNAKIFIDTAFGTEAAPMDVGLANLWNSVLEISADFHITNDITEDGGSTVNISNGASVSARKIEVSNISVTGTGTNLTLTAESSFIGDTNVSGGAHVKSTNGQTLNVQSVNSSSGNTTFTDATFSGTMETRNGGTTTFINSVFNAGQNNESIKSGGQMTFIMDNSKYNHYYTGWDTDTEAKWRENIMFIGLGGGAEQTFTFKNGSFINGGGSADGTSFWDMDPATRTLASMTDGGKFNLGWNEFSNDTDFFTINFESGTKVAAKGVDFGNNNLPNSNVGKITWNQGGTDLDSGYTQVYISGDFNLRGSVSSASNNSYVAEANMNGYSYMELYNLNIGQNGMAGGEASFNIKGSHNTLVAESIYLAQNGMVGGDAAFTMLGEGNGIVVNRIRMGDGDSKDSSMGGTTSFYAKGSNASNKNVIIIKDSELILQGSTTVGSTFSSSFTLDGNTVLRGNNGLGVWLKLNEWGGKNYTSDVKFTVSGSGNDILLSGLEIGKDTTTGGGTATFEVIGGGSSILIQNAADSSDNHNGFKLESGGLLSYTINDTGISTIKNTTWNNANFSGDLLVNLTEFAGDLSDARFVLFSTTDMSLQNQMTSWFDFSDWNNLVELSDFITVLLRDGTDVYHFALETHADAELGQDVQSLVLYYAGMIPEPSTYAAIFGLAALLFALRRRKLSA